MFNRILIPLDGSHVAEEAVGLVQPLLHVEDPHVELLGVIPVAIHEGVPADAAAIRAQADEEAAYLERVAVRLREGGADVRIHLRYGHPADEILKFTLAVQTDLIAMTTHGRSGLSRLVLGSICERIMRATRVPLLLRKSHGDEVLRPIGPFHKILVPLDGHPESEQILPFAEALARAYKAELSVVMVLHGEESVAAALAPGGTERYLEGVCERFRERRLTAASEVRHGDPAAEIRGLIDREKPDLVAMTTHGRGGLSRWVIGSVAETVLRSVATPLFVVRANAEVQGHEDPGR